MELNLNIGNIDKDQLIQKLTIENEKMKQTLDGLSFLGIPFSHIKEILDSVVKWCGSVNPSDFNSFMETIFITKKIEIKNLEFENQKYKSAIIEVNKHWFDPQQNQGIACIGCDVNIDDMIKEHEETCPVGIAHKTL